MITRGWLLGFLLIGSVNVFAQVKTIIRSQIDTLCSEYFRGRGYVDSGSIKAGQYLTEQFKKLDLDDWGINYQQHYTLSVNRFPGEVHLKINGQTLSPGVDFLPFPTSSSTRKKWKQIHSLDISKMNENDLKNQSVKMSADNLYWLEGLDSVAKHQKLRSSQMFAYFNKGTYLVPQHKKPLWPASKTQQSGSYIFLYDSLQTSSKIKKVDYQLQAVYDSAYPAMNVIATVKGKDASCNKHIVITAHYDHVGGLGKKVFFPGANDNASGTAMVLALAQYFQKHPLHCPVTFMLFSGEELGLLGSKYYTENPIFPLENIQFLINLDMVGTGEKGISVINGLKQPEEVKTIERINETFGDKKLSEIVSGASSANSDHHHFIEKGVPAIFIFSRGGKGFYHDVWDVPSSLDLEKTEEIYQLLINFIKAKSEA